MTPTPPPHSKGRGRSPGIGRGKPKTTGAYKGHVPKKTPSGKKTTSASAKGGTARATVQVNVHNPSKATARGGTRGARKPPVAKSAGNVSITPNEAGSTTVSAQLKVGETLRARVRKNPRAKNPQTVITAGITTQRKSAAKPHRPVRTRVPKTTVSRLPVPNAAPWRKGNPTGVELLFEHAIRAHNKLREKPTGVASEYERRKELIHKEIEGAKKAIHLYQRKQIGAGELAERTRHWKAPIVRNIASGFWKLRARRNITLENREKQAINELDQYAKKIDSVYKEQIENAKMQHATEFQGQINGIKQELSLNTSQVHQYFKSELNDIHQRREWATKMKKQNPSFEEQMTRIQNNVRKINNPETMFNFEVWYRWVFGYMAMGDFKSAQICLNELDKLSK